MNRVRSPANLSLVLLFACGNFFLSACGIHKDKQQLQDLTRFRNSASYRIVNENIFQKYQCLNCHSSSGMSMGGIALDQYDLVHANIKRIETAVLIKQNMPPSGPIPLSEQALLREWIDKGAPEFPEVTPLNPSDSTPTPAPPSPPPPVLLEPKFNSIYVNILAKKCITCHSPTGTVPKIPMTSYEAILKSVREIVMPLSPDESGIVIFTEITDSDPKRMPPVKSGLPRLTKDETLTIRQWILNGAKND